MRSTFVLAGAALAAVLTVVAVVGALQEWWWLVVGAAMLLLSAVLIVAMDADRRVRGLRPYIRAEVARGAAVPTSAATPPTVSDADITGAVRVLQAQYTGRLDRMQTSVDEALAQLRSQGESAREPRDDQE
ncbi:hypothetical protein NF556_21140 [Ornithinimicrobium faecis]|uniref:Uncharacterized protein n=1 Tax=Ornithinimicrobium faecis TaxID=2934158 RepID=A0ABY4YUM4_9MICO|nr:hypothetical protein [Ornithinimicrobium sp. HY1793]USQ80058.1 hypothetical protein NF556_21140 [Ornithinimicrobium sp. HY1793]